MGQTLSVTEAARHFAEYINRVAYRGESFVLVRGNKPVAELRPLPMGGGAACGTSRDVGRTAPSHPERSGEIC